MHEHNDPVAAQVATHADRTTRLNELEAVVDANLDGFIAIARALTTIRDEALFTDAGYATFDDYLQQRWKRAMRYRVMQSAAALLDVSTVLDSDQLRVIQNPAQAHALTEFAPAVRVAVVEVLNNTVPDKHAAKDIKRIGRALTSIYDELTTTGTIEVTEGTQLTPQQIAAISSRVLLEMRETGLRELENVNAARAKLEPVYEATGRADDLLTWRVLGSQLSLTDATVAVKVYANTRGFTIRVERQDV